MIHDRPLTPSQIVCLQFIEAYIETHGFAPNVREIQAHIKHKSTSSVANLLTGLRAAGYISSEPKIARSIRVLRQYNSDKAA